MRSCKCVLILSFAQCQTCASLPGEEVSEVDEFTMSFVFDIDDSPSVLPAPYCFAINDDTSFRADNSEGEHFLLVSSV